MNTPLIIPSNYNQIKNIGTAEAFNITIHCIKECQRIVAELPHLGVEMATKFNLGTMDLCSVVISYQDIHNNNYFAAFDYSHRDEQFLPLGEAQKLFTVEKYKRMIKNFSGK